MPHINNRNNRRSRQRRTSNAPVPLRLLKPTVSGTPATNNASTTSATGKSGGPRKRPITRRRQNAPTWLTVVLTFFFGIVLAGAVVFGILAKELMVIVLAVLVVFVTYLFVIKHFYPSEGGSSSPLFTFILEVLKIFKGIH